MHKATLRKLVKQAGLADCVEIHTGKEVEILVTDESGEVDREATEAKQKLFCSKVANWGGIRNGYGAWMMREDYTSKGDWNDRTSPWHY